MRLDTDDTIAAIASAMGAAARGIIRISGPDAVASIRLLFEGRRPLDQIRIATCVDGTLRLPDPLGDIECRALIWPDGRSYTGQPAVELHLPGSRPLLESALEQLCESRFVRLAERGEFTLCAFLAGRMDLTQAEAVLGVIQATSPRQLQDSLWQLAGGLAGPLHQLRNEMLDLLAHLEAGLDFVEEDIEFISKADLEEQLSNAFKIVERIQDQMEHRNDHRQQCTVVLRGLPNAGKSSLLNTLAEQQAAIVSPQAGTTRDYVSRDVVWEGVAIELVDTAGVESEETFASASDQWIRSAAQQAMQRQQRSADLELYCIDSQRGMTDADYRHLQTPTRDRIVVLTKTDGDVAIHDNLPAGIATSSVNGEGIVALRKEITQRLCQDSADSSTGTAARCRDSLRDAGRSLAQALEAAREGWGEELVAAEVRGALEHLGRVVGAVYTDDVLDRIFSRFCIGK